MKIILALFMIVPFPVLAAVIPQKFQGSWDKTSQCYTPAIIKKGYFTSDADWGLAKVSKVKVHNTNSITAYGTEEFHDEGKVYKTFSQLKFTLSNNNQYLTIVGEHHAQKYNVRYVRCS